MLYLVACDFDDSDDYQLFKTRKEAVDHTYRTLRNYWVEDRFGPIPADVDEAMIMFNTCEYSQEQINIHEVQIIKSDGQTVGQ